MKKVHAVLALTVLLTTSCNNSSDSVTNANDSGKSYYDSTAAISADEEARAAELNFIIAAAKQTLDSIDAAYTFVRSSVKLAALSLDDREQLNAALQQMNDTRDLIILETQKEVLEQLMQKTSTFKVMVAAMRSKSVHLEGIARKLTQLSDMIQKTTDALVSAFSSGIIKPKIAIASKAKT